MAAGDVHVREIEPGDRARWRELYRGYRDFYEMAPDDTVLDTVWSWLLDPTHEVNGLVAVDGTGAVTGIAHWRLFARPLRGGTAIFLDDLFTDPATRGQGVARALLSRLGGQAAADGHLGVRWLTAASNTTARRLYDRVATASEFVTYDMPPAPTA